LALKRSKKPIHQAAVPAQTLGFGEAHACVEGSVVWHSIQKEQLDTPQKKQCFEIFGQASVARGFQQEITQEVSMP